MTTPLYPAGQNQIAALTGQEQVAIDGGGATSAFATTQQIADLAPGSTITNTAITTVGAGVLTGAALNGGLISRTGPVAAYTDTTDTAANIVTALGGFEAADQFQVRIKNATAFPQTLAAGASVTMSAANVIGPFQEGVYLGVVGGTSAVPTIVFTHLVTTAISSAQNVVQPAITTLATVGAGTVLAAAINGGVVQRTGAQSNTAVADTTDTAANIIAGNPGLVAKIGTSFTFRYQNTTNANVTLGGGAGVTVSGLTVIPAGSWVDYVVTYTAAATLTMVGVASAPPTTVSGTFVANGATAVVVANTNVTANSVISYAMKTVGGTPAGAPFLSAVTPGTGFSVKVAAGDTSTYNYTIIN